MTITDIKDVTKLQLFKKLLVHNFIRIRRRISVLLYKEFEELFLAHGSLATENQMIQ
jgi:hypothetical protein